MTDQIPADAIRAWRDKYQGCTGNNALAALDALLPAPPRPTLADMTEEERGKHVGGQVDVSAEAFGGRAILTGFETVTLMGAEFPRALILTRDCRTISAPTDEVTPRPDLPRLEWPGDKKPAPAPSLPGGWRLANHPAYGRVIVTRTAPDADGNVCFVTPVPGLLGHDWNACSLDDLTYLDGPESPTPARVGDTIKSADDPRIDSLPTGSILRDLDGDDVEKTATGERNAGDITIETPGCGPWTVHRIGNGADQ